ncbi:MAG: hypothetical protein K2M06_00120 [Muribaculaceae bacterium]|nr:hypothetical protein [Muribaculaceae bacterium]
MKKFYTLALAAVVALSASAAEKQSFKISAPFFNAEMKASVEAFENEMNISKARKAAPAKAVAVSDITALNQWVYSDGEDQEESLKITMEDEATGKLKIQLTDRSMFTIQGVFDASKGTVSIPNMQYLFDDEDGPIYFYIKEFDAASGEIKSGASAVAASVGTYANGSVVFTPADIWAIGDPAHEELKWYYLSIMNEFSVKPESYMGSFKENIIGWIFQEGLPEQKNFVDVEVRFPNEYTVEVIDPLKALYAVLGFNAVSPKMVLDITDPANVLLGLTSTGITPDRVNVYSYFNFGWYFEDEPESMPADRKCTMTKEGDEATIIFPVGSCLMYDPSDEEDPVGVISKYESVLKFKMPSENAGIGSVAVEEEGNGPAVYYNLQGVRVENPSNGIVIRVQNGKASKMLVK